MPFDCMCLEYLRCCLGWNTALLKYQLWLQENLIAEGQKGHIKDMICSSYITTCIHMEPLPIHTENNKLNCACSRLFHRYFPWVQRYSNKTSKYAVGSTEFCKRMSKVLPQLRWDIRKVYIPGKICNFFHICLLFESFCAASRDETSDRPLCFCLLFLCPGITNSRRILDTGQLQVIDSCFYS